jgi:polar amino acid transport system substrate-binding protein/glutamate/aspartate transport system substrate-binding protein
MRALGIASTLPLLGVAQGQAAVLDRARETGELRIAYRADAEPFSYANAQGQAAGYSVDLCKAVARTVAQKVGKPDLKLVEVEVSATDRLDAVVGGKADILCEATTVTLSRRETLDFSLPTFATGATLLYPVDGAKSFEDLAGKKVGVLTGSTTETGLREALGRAKIQAEVVTVPTHTDGIQMLASGELAAYFGDGAILLFNLMQSPFRDRLRVSDKVLSFEPYALALPHGDDAFRLVVDSTLAQLSRSGEVGKVFEAAFGPGATPSDLVRALWLLNAIPE